MNLNCKRWFYTVNTGEAFQLPLQHNTTRLSSCAGGGNVEREEQVFDTDPSSLVRYAAVSETLFVSTK